MAKDTAHDCHATPLGAALIDTDALGPLAAFGWSEDFAEQLDQTDANLVPMRIATVHRARMTAISPSGIAKLAPPPGAGTVDFAVGDWVLVDAEARVVRHRLSRRTELARRTEGGRVPQLIAANIDTLFIVSSCNADFNPARLERYLALANEAGATPVIVLTKADATADANDYRIRAEALQRGLAVLAVNAKSPELVAALAPWCGAGRTVALVGSSGVGKSTILNMLAGPDQAAPQETAAIRENDARGRHTTTSRSLHAIPGGGWLIDTPGMRALNVGDAAFGIETLFAEITELAPLCKFRDCTHAHEPGCAVRAAVAAGDLPEERLTRWRKLHEENLENTPAPVRPSGRGKKR